MRMRCSIAWFALAWGFCCAATAPATESWGNLTITFRYDGEPPQPEKIQLDKDPAARREPLYDESLLVHKQNRGVANVVAYLLNALPAQRINWSAAPPKNSVVQFTSEQLQFKPHICVMRTDQRLLLVNQDAAGHAPNFGWIYSSPFAYSMGETYRVGTGAAEKLPINIGCSIHPWESAWLVMRDNPYCGVSDENGKLVIKNLPLGEWTFQLWHERTRGLAKGRLAGNDVVWDQGHIKVRIAEGENDLGIAELPAELFRRPGVATQKPEK